MKSRYVVHSYFNQNHWNKRQEYFKQYKKQDSTIIFVGNSITEGFDLSIFNNKKVLNMGIAGDFTSGILKRSNQIVALKPIKIFLLIGINDIIEKVPMNIIQENYKNIISTFRKELPNSTIYVHTVLPIKDVKSFITTNQSNSSKIIEFNKFIKENYSNKPNITLIDLFPLYKTDNNEMRQDLTTDGIHLNIKGYSIWHKKILEFISTNKVN